MPFYLTDVFILEGYSGNQLATLIPARALSARQMQSIARELNFSETTFVTGGDTKQGFHTRIFTPTEEIPFAGHPVLGTAFVLREVFGLQSSTEVTLNLQGGKITVTFEDPGFQFFTRQQMEISAELDRADLVESLGLNPEDIDNRYPCCRVSSGLRFLIIPLVSVAALQCLDSRQVRCEEPVFLFAPADENMQEHIRARMFAPELGMVEDAATGSASCALGGYLVEHEYFGSGQVRVLIGQGFEMGRPSHIHVTASKKEKHFHVEVGGKVRLIAQGDWLIN
ncbi:MAG: PhzF family phenazine biosynthesis protein [Gammaproteobacteria bacterium]|nr:PhzF family phenazine biosynthesis protein [Gammaproteobacteria bacterium]MBT5204086.1 PhzF family phenazine biosynthesis protein [Gammaproteobacteria bacterium]MBT5602048.1 PhzF family phenazine biosynthesis protein [Gammaproteobacteria bacterium]MBT6247363.1 PhzF family phenazine biosynthesis protein [Gammaproteobacteria bacterium]